MKKRFAQHVGVDFKIACKRSHQFVDAPQRELQDNIDAVRCARFTLKGAC
jgi:hypothetical protein